MVRLLSWTSTSTQISTTINVSHPHCGIVTLVITVLTKSDIDPFHSSWPSAGVIGSAVDRHQGTLHLITYVCRGERTVSGEQSARWDAFASCKDLLIHSWWTGCHADATHWQSLKRPWRVLRQWGFMVVIHWKMFLSCTLKTVMLDTFLGCTCAAGKDKQQRQKSQWRL